MISPVLCTVCCPRRRQRRDSAFHLVDSNDNAKNSSHRRKSTLRIKPRIFLFGNTAIIDEEILSFVCICLSSSSSSYCDSDMVHYGGAAFTQYKLRFAPFFPVPPPPHPVYNSDQILPRHDGVRAIIATSPLITSRFFSHTLYLQGTAPSPSARCSQEFSFSEKKSTEPRDEVGMSML
jgi:hypothetical protein